MLRRSRQLAQLLFTAWLIGCAGNALPTEPPNSEGLYLVVDGQYQPLQALQNLPSNNAEVTLVADDEPMLIMYATVSSPLNWQLLSLPLGVTGSDSVPLTNYKFSRVGADDTLLQLNFADPLTNTLYCLQAQGVYYCFQSGTETEVAQIATDETSVATSTISPTATEPVAVTPSATSSPVASATPSPVPSATPTQTPSPTLTPTATPTPDRAQEQSYSLSTGESWATVAAQFGFSIEELATYNGLEPDSDIEGATILIPPLGSFEQVWETSVTGVEACHLLVLDHPYRVRAEAQLWSLPDATVGERLTSIASNSEVEVIDAPQWGQIEYEQALSGWWSLVVSAETSDTGWLWQSHIVGCPLPEVVTSAALENPRQIGTTVNGAPIDVWRFGTGENVVLFIGGLHAGFAPSSVAIAERLINHLNDMPTDIPDTATIYIIPSIAIDSPVRPGQMAGRYNANGVDLNRNWDCGWREDATVLGRLVTGSGGSAPFSEPEVAALRDFILAVEPRGVIFWEAAANNGLASPGSCGVGSAVSQPLANSYGFAAGFRVVDYELATNQELNGDGSNWLDSIGIPAAAVLLDSHTGYDWGDNLAGIRAVLDDFGR